MYFKPSRAIGRRRYNGLYRLLPRKPYSLKLHDQARVITLADRNLKHRRKWACGGSKRRKFIPFLLTRQEA